MDRVSMKGDNIHLLAEVSDRADLHPSVLVYQFATVCADVKIEENCVVGSNVFIGQFTRIGKGTRIQHGVFLPKGCVIGENVFIGPNVTVTDDKYPMVNNSNYKAEPPVFCSNSMIGAGAIILPGVVIGNYARVAAGAVVNRNVPDGCVAVGNPCSIKELADNDPIFTRVDKNFGKTIRY